MTQQPSAALDTIQIRYRISYLTWLRMKAWAQRKHITLSAGCEWLLMQALDAEGVTADPAVLLGLKEKPGE